MQTTGSNTGTWGSVLNDQTISYIDQNMGGITSLSLSSTNVTLSADQSRNAILRLTGTLTNNIVITTSCLGFFFVENLTTGAFVVTVRNASVATAATISRGSRQTVLSDASNGCRILSSGFEAGVKASFYMSTPPLGWTRDATAALNNALPRLVTTGGAATGGTNNFTTVNSSIVLTVSNLPDHNITITDPGHNHTYTRPTGTRFEQGEVFPYPNDEATATTSTSFTGITAAFGTAARGGAQTGIAMNIKYADFLVATRD